MTYAFRESAIKELILSEKCTRLDTYAFNQCSKLTRIEIRAVNPPTMAHTNVFESTGNCPIYVPAESVEVYKTATNWSAYASRIVAIP